MEKTIGEVQKGKITKAVIRLTEYKGRKLLDIRDFFQPKGSNDYVPTKKGIAIDISKIGDIITLLEKAESTI